MTNEEQIRLAGDALEGAHRAVCVEQLHRARVAIAELAGQVNPSWYSHAHALDDLIEADSMLRQAHQAIKAAQTAITRAHVALTEPAKLFPALPITEGGDEPDAADNWKK